MYIFTIEKGGILSLKMLDCMIFSRAVIGAVRQNWPITHGRDKMLNEYHGMHCCSVQGKRDKY